MLASFVPKKISVEVKNTPPASSIINVCAKGSTQPIVLLDCLVDTLLIVLLDVVEFLSSCGSLVEIIVFCTVSKIPLAT